MNQPRIISPLERQLPPAADAGRIAAGDTCALSLWVGYTGAKAAATRFPDSRDRRPENALPPREKWCMRR